MTRSIKPTDAFSLPEIKEDTTLTGLILKEHLNGVSNDVIARGLNLEESVVERYIEIAFNTLSGHFTSADSMRLFLRYAAFQLQLINDLDQVIKAWHDGGRDPRGSSAVVNSIKLKSDLFDKIYDKGKETHNLTLQSKESELEALSSSPEKVKEILRSQVTTIINILNGEVSQGQVLDVPSTKRVVMRQFAGDTPNFLSNQWIQGIGAGVDTRKWALEYARLRMIKENRINQKKLLTGQDR